MVMPEKNARFLCSIGMMRLVDLGYEKESILDWASTDLDDTVATKHKYEIKS